MGPSSLNYIIFIELTIISLDLICVTTCSHKHFPPDDAFLKVKFLPYIYIAPWFDKDFQFGFVTRLETHWGQLLFIICAYTVLFKLFYLFRFSSCLFRPTLMYLSLRFFGYLVFGGIMFFVNSTAWSVLHHVHFTGNLQSIPLRVIFVFLIISVKCMFPLLTCTCLRSLVCFCVIFLHLFWSHYSLLIMRLN